tara:strand:+ start:1547 stop:1756 length:210 start_codon:yes stop_codon:yes gene_type:complete
MPRILTYKKDEKITDDDIILGSDGDSSSHVTKKFTIKQLRSYIIPSGATRGQVLGADSQGNLAWVDYSG